MQKVQVLQNAGNDGVHEKPFFCTAKFLGNERANTTLIL